MGLYKLILVDDEEDVRVSIEKKVDWEALGFQLVGSANNGEEALELAEQMHVDAVLTDIKMPFMDGLTLSAKLKENYANTKVVLYSGFDEFELAREAIHLEVEEYLLKPISASDLERVFSKVKETLDKEIDERRNIEHLMDYYERSLPVMKEQLLSGLLEGKLTSEHANALMESYHMEFKEPQFAVAVIGMGVKGEQIDWEKEQMLMLSLKKMTEEYLEKQMKINVLMHLDTIAVIAHFEHPNEIHGLVYHMNQICKMGARMLGVTVDAGIGNAYSQHMQLHQSHEEAKMAYEHCLLLDGENQAIFIHDVEPGNSSFLFDAGTYIQEMIQSMKFGKEGSIASSIEKFVRDLKQEKISKQQYDLFLMELVTEIFKVMRNYEIEVAAVFGDGFEPYRVLHSFHSLDDMAEWLNGKCEAISNMIRKERVHTTNLLTEKAKNYIEENYGQCDLSVEDLCRHLNVSATYFSVTFKKETGMSFVSYLTKVRLEHAKELLDETEEKSYMIAEKVGYSEANYFSYVFKKQYGVSPSKYRSTKG